MHTSKKKSSIQHILFSVVVSRFKSNRMKTRRLKLGKKQFWKIDISLWRCTDQNAVTHMCMKGYYHIDCWLSLLWGWQYKRPLNENHNHTLYYTKNCYSSILIIFSIFYLFICLQTSYARIPLSRQVHLLPVHHWCREWATESLLV